jgi:DNA-binding response OmpR family regulator
VKILLVEDDPQVSRFIARGLSEERFVVDVATNG